MQLTLLGTTVKKIVGYGANLYHFTEAGLDVHTQADGTRLAWASLANVTCGAVNDSGIYLGTTAAGVYFLSHSAVTTGGDRTADIVQRYMTTSVPPLASNVINSLAGNGTQLLVTTAAGATWLPDSAETGGVEEGTLRPTWREHKDAAGCGATAISAVGDTLYTAAAGGTGGVSVIDPDAVLTAAAISTMGATLSDTGKWSGGVVGPNGKIYAVPSNATDILIIDPVAGTATRSAMGASLTGTAKWYGGVLAPNGKIYCIPGDATDILIIDPVAGTATRSAMGASLTGTAKWIGGALGADGKIYGMPYAATDILIIDPVAGTATRSAMGASLGDASKWMGAVAGPDGKIYGMPRDATDILIIDPVAGTATRSAMGASLSGASKWWGGVLAPNGRIYGIPRRSADFLIIDPAAGTATRSTLGLSGLSTNVDKWIGGGCLGVDGNIYAAPAYESSILIINPAAGTATRSSMGASIDTSANKWDGSVAGPDGKIYGMPRDYNGIIAISPPAPATLTTPAIASVTIRDLGCGGDLFIATDSGVSIWDGTSAKNLTTELGTVQDVVAIHPGSTATKNTGYLAYGTSDGLDGGQFGVLNMAEVP